MRVRPSGAGQGPSGRRWGPDDDLTVAVLVNSGAASAGRLEEPLARAVLGIPAPEVADRPVSTALAGRYAIDGELPAEIRVRQGKLYAQAEGQREFRLLSQGTKETEQGPAAVFRSEFDPEAVKLDFLLPDDPGVPSPPSSSTKGRGPSGATGREEGHRGTEGQPARRPGRGRASYAPSPRGPVSRGTPT